MVRIQGDLGSEQSGGEWFPCAETDATRYELLPKSASASPPAPGTTHVPRNGLCATRVPRSPEVTRCCVPGLAQVFNLWEASNLPHECLGHPSSGAWRE